MKNGSFKQSHLPIVILLAMMLVSSPIPSRATPPRDVRGAAQVPTAEYLSDAERMGLPKHIENLFCCNIDGSDEGMITFNSDGSIKNVEFIGVGDPPQVKIVNGTIVSFYGDIGEKFIEGGKIIYKEVSPGVTEAFVNIEGTRRVIAIITKDKANRIVAIHGVGDKPFYRKYTYDSANNPLDAERGVYAVPLLDLVHAFTGSYDNWITNPALGHVTKVTGEAWVVRTKSTGVYGCQINFKDRTYMFGRSEQGIRTKYYCMQYSDNSTTWTLYDVMTGKKTKLRKTSDVVPRGWKVDYQAHSQWKLCKEIVEESGSDEITLSDITYALNHRQQTATAIQASEDIVSANIPAEVAANGTTYTVTAIGNNAFWACTNLTAITLPQTLTTIGSFAFYFCSSLHTITLPASLRSIGQGAFRNCNSLTTIVSEAMAPPSAEDVGTDLINVTLSVPAAAYEAYAADSEWRQSKKIIKPVSDITIDGITYQLNYADTTASVAKGSQGYLKVEILEEVIVDNQRFVVTSVEP